jgi:hypothetical protein
MNVTANPVFSELFNVDPLTLDSPMFHSNKVDADNNTGALRWPGLTRRHFDSGWLESIFGNRKSGLSDGLCDWIRQLLHKHHVEHTSGRAGFGLRSGDLAGKRRQSARASESISIAAKDSASSDDVSAQAAVSKNLRNPYYLAAGRASAA